MLGAFMGERHSRNCKREKPKGLPQLKTMWQASKHISACNKWDASNGFRLPAVNASNK
jgi:hypothetical protein